jgi:hypothetical protein
LLWWQFISPPGLILTPTKAEDTFQPKSLNPTSKRRFIMESYNPEQALLKARREFGEHGGVAPSISRSATFTVMHPNTMPEIFSGLKGPEQG